VTRALSFTRPWTDLILSGEKAVENRVWKTPHRGLLVVHGAKSWDPAARALFDELVGLMPDEADRYAPRSNQDSPTGYLGVVDVTDCHLSGDLLCGPFADWCDECSPWAFAGQFHWTLATPRRFPEPIPGGGHLGLFDVPPEVEAAVAALS
jgi:hypothetical protein